MITKPAIVEANDKIAAAEAGSAGGGLMRCFPPSPSATMYTTRTGIQASRSYLRSGVGRQIHEIGNILPVENSQSTE